MSLKNLIKKYEDRRKFVDSKEARRMYGAFATSDHLLHIDEFIKDLKEVNK